MRNLIPFLILISSVYVVSVKTTSFVCSLDGTCFAQCVEDNIPIESCELECTVCQWR